jgi:hypothetical protein
MLVTKFYDNVFSKNICSIVYILKAKGEQFYSEYCFSVCPHPYRRKGILLTKKRARFGKARNKRGWKGRRINIGKTKSAYWSPGEESVKLEKEINLQREKSENPRKRLIQATTTF